MHMSACPSLPCRGVSHGHAHTLINGAERETKLVGVGLYVDHLDPHRLVYLEMQRDRETERMRHRETERERGTNTEGIAIHTNRDTRMHTHTQAHM
jgi:hypothetical protein